MTLLIEHVRKYGSPKVVQERIKYSATSSKEKEKGKGKPVLVRWQGETVGPPDAAKDEMKEDDIVVSDPRKSHKLYKAPNTLRPLRSHLTVVKYEVLASTHFYIYN